MLRCIDLKVTIQLHQCWNGIKRNNVNVCSCINNDLIRINSSSVVLKIILNCTKCQNGTKNVCDELSCAKISDFIMY